MERLKADLASHEGPRTLWMEAHTEELDRLADEIGPVWASRAFGMSYSAVNSWQYARKRRVSGDQARTGKPAAGKRRPKAKTSETNGAAPVNGDHHDRYIGALLDILKQPNPGKDFKTEVMDRIERLIY